MGTADLGTTTCRLPRPRTARPIGIAVHVDARRTLERIAIYHALVTKEVPTEPLQGSFREFGRGTHEPARFLGRKLQINAILG